MLASYTQKKIEAIVFLTMFFKDGGQVNRMLNFLVSDLSLRTPERASFGTKLNVNLQF